MEWIEEMHPVVAPDVENSRSKHGNIPKIELAVWIIVGLASSLVALRLYYHLLRGRRRLWSDDYFLVAALLCLIGNAVTIWEWVPYKLEPNVTTKPSEAQVLIGSLMGLFNSFALAFSKTSLAITFIRLTTGWWKSSLGLSIFVIDILFAVQAWSFWVQDCDGPVEPFRIQTTRDGCISFESIRSLRLIIQVLSCGLDAYYTFLPWKIVRSLELKRFEKIGLAIAMSFGFGSLGCGLVRMGVLLRLANQTYEYQPLYSVGGYLFNYCEPGFSITAACMPVLRKVVMDTILWRKVTSALRWIPHRRKKRSVTAVLPLCENSAGSTCESKSTSDQTDTTLVRPETPTTPEKVALFTTPEKKVVRLTTPSTGRTCCTCSSPPYKIEHP
ncbi:hypothetical protein NPX13_g2054 [Xylaria arbuscula]|uniref:Rhodopsin domain-containing protein n=1 Tax=Xylaria arbuscula TaxID=114810 RepID=A0A9W8TRD7_9PEZI|nr:hypothetical protein NPX13_g2054 [Xylaria arbuscula]